MAAQPFLGPAVAADEYAFFQDLGKGLIKF